MTTSPAAATAAAASAENLFAERFGIDERALHQGLSAVQQRRVDYADLFFEYGARDSITLEEGIVKSGARRITQGCGVRAIDEGGERQGSAHTDAINAEAVLLAAQNARAIAADAAAGALSKSGAARSAAAPSQNLYPVSTAPTDVPVAEKTALLNAIDQYARAQSPRVRKVMAAIACEQRAIMVAGSDGRLCGDVQPLVRLNVQVICEHNGRREAGYQGAGGRYELGLLLHPDVWQPVAAEAVRLALTNLEAAPCPAGTMDVVLGPGWPGVLLHEAVGHGLEGDFNRKGQSAFAGRIGERVAASGVTVLDCGTFAQRRGSLNMDDEGTPTQRTTLIEDGILRGYLHDRLNARLMGHAPTGNGRRESYAHLPLPRMTNTFMLAGEDAPEDVLRSVPHGLYAVSFGGGQVDISSGKFVFECTEAYQIEGGRIGRPVRGATLIGNGPDILQRVAMIGGDLKFDHGVGTCGKEGQSVPVGVGLPTLRINQVTVGGTAQ